ncbi:MAG: bifunctional DNA primase/polymerase [Nitrospira sp.]|nr:bifunctional DNA primase/polymerase [Nitrospira sp.]
MSETTMWDLFQAEVLRYGRLYIALRWHVFPCWTVDEEGCCTCPQGSECPDIGKHPIGDLVPNGFKNASCDSLKVEEWWGPGTPPRNIAIATGKVSRLTIADIDMGPGKVGAQTWMELIREKGEPQTLMAQTGGGGFHVFFKYCPDLKTGNNRLGKHIDVKNDGGYIIVPPSRHRSGRSYEWPTIG